MKAKKQPFLLQLANNIFRFGWKWVAAVFVPAYWTQDCNFENNGYDIISFSKPKGHYFYGTVAQVRTFLKESYGANAISA